MPGPRWLRLLRLRNRHQRASQAVIGATHPLPIEQPSLTLHRTRPLRVRGLLGLYRCRRLCTHCTQSQRTMRPHSLSSFCLMPCGAPHRSTTRSCFCLQQALQLSVPSQPIWCVAGVHGRDAKGGGGC